MKFVFLASVIFIIAVKFINCDETSLEVSLRDDDDDDDMSYERFMDAEDVFELVQKVVSRSKRAGIRASDLIRIARDVKENADRFTGRVSGIQIEREISEGARRMRIVPQVRALFGNNVRSQRLNVALKLWGVLANKGHLYEDQRRPYASIMAAVSRTATRISLIAPRLGNRFISYNGPY